MIDVHDQQSGIGDRKTHTQGSCTFVNFDLISFVLPGIMLAQW